MKMIECTEQAHAAEILAIFNDAISTSTVLYDYKPRTPEMMAAWFETKRRGSFPVLGAVDEETGELMGFGSYGSFRPHPAYKYTVEHSIYVAAKYRRRGLGKRLLIDTIARAREQEYHVLVGVIDSLNTVSIRLHEAFGFLPCGTMRQVGFKFGTWLDICFYQLVLDTPVQPADG